MLDDRPEARTEPDGVLAGPAERSDARDLTFLDLPRLELDQLLAQLVERAQEVMATQGRLRGLLRANHMITGGLALPEVLHRIVEAARELVGARYAALGVLAPDGGLAEFVHVGFASDLVDEIGHLPVGKGLLGALIDDPRPIRLGNLADDSRSSGFPSSHPPMGSFLGVPIRIRDVVFGNLYLTESTHGEFSAEDEELTTALAATAAAVIDNSHLYEAARLRGEWLQATAAITRGILTAAPDDPVVSLRLIADRSREVADADVVTIALPNGGQGGDLRVSVAVGPSADDVMDLAVPLNASLSGQAFTTGKPVRLTSPDESPSLRYAVSAVVDAGPLMIVPLRGSDRVHGVLNLVRLRGRAAFSAEDLDLATGFANQAAVALELAQARADQQRAALFDERERIAADLHDHVIQRLFAAGLSLQALAATLGPGRATDRVMSTVGDLDATISQIRTAIFQLQQTSQTTARTLRARVLDLVGELTPALGFDPAVRFSGLLDTIADRLSDDLLAVVREALSNVARHADAHAAEIDLTAHDDQVMLIVRDDGVGLSDTTRSSGLANMRRRAQHHGGSFLLEPDPGGGTLLTWTALLDC
ncbi:MAG TPA: GAF domain-containing protein [Pseudonocardia sp.]|nr:GAF domain-containing protein [Pseudonocardia sp.]